MKKGDIVYKAHFPDKQKPTDITVTKYTVEDVKTYKKPRALIPGQDITDKTWLTIQGVNVPKHLACTSEQEAYKNAEQALIEFKKHKVKLLQDARQRKQQADTYLQELEQKIEEDKDIEYKRIIEVRKALAQYT
jgi:alpha-D-ribose 1-methylphosphonate 5-phosphate C-P lyase